MKILINSLGCPKNLVDSEIIANNLKNAGYELTADINDADMAIINTCAFIEPAVKEAIYVILKTSESKQNGKLKKLIVTGCLVERFKTEILENMPEVDLCIGIDGYNNISDLISKVERTVICGAKTDSSFMNKKRLLSYNNGSAYLKIAEGCDNHCTYCTIPKIRGKQRSRSIEDICSEAADLVTDFGVREITLIAQDTTAYGKDIYMKPSLNELLIKLEKIEGLLWIRLLYCYPELISDELIDTIKNSSKILHYIDIPLQHASDRILKLMGRKGSYEKYRSLISKIRTQIPDMIIRTTFIAGFPDETEEDFDILCRFLEECRFDRAGVFEYCMEDGTPAAKMKNQITQKSKADRKEKLMLIQQKIAFEKNNERLKKIYSIIIQDVADDGIFYEGRSYGEAYEIDPLVYVSSKEPLEIGQIVDVRMLNTDGYSIIGEVIGQ